LYWFLLAYIIAMLVWWFIALNQQNQRMTENKLLQLRQNDFFFREKQEKIYEDKKRKTAQYFGEGVAFLMLIVTGAVFVFRAIRRQFKQSLEQQNFMMAITHELKTPIAITRLNLETLQKHKLTGDQQQRLITNTLQEANRLNDLCNNLLLASQIEAGGYTFTEEAIDLTELVSGCAQDFITRYPQRKIFISVPPQVNYTGDRLLLQMAVNNLLDNAIKYSSKEKNVWISLQKDNDKIRLSVKDEGKGINESEKDKVFDKFYRIGNPHTKGSRGTGLGLYVTGRIVQQHKADIMLTNNIPQGSIFEIILKQKNG
jgi:two-component system, OmpR family, sensor histidine kinase CiaH